jgi:diguanylate cyclase (GGDEF)-like protein
MVGLDVGADEYLTKPVDPAELSLRVRNLLRLKTHGDFVAVDGPPPEFYAQTPTADERHPAHYDAVTGLPNATLFLEALRKSLLEAVEKDAMVAVLSIDLDDFKTVNDALGTAAGDELLCQFGTHLVRCAGGRDNVSRMYGDKFALLVPTQADRQSAIAIANAIQEVLRTPFDFKGSEVLTTASIGIAIYPKDASDPVGLAARADGARRQAKKAGGDSFVFYSA